MQASTVICEFLCVTQWHYSYAWVWFPLGVCGLLLAFWCVFCSVLRMVYGTERAEFSYPAWGFFFYPDWGLSLTLPEDFSFTLTEVYLLPWLRFFSYPDWGFSLTLTEVFLCFFLNCKVNASVKLAKTGHGPHSSTLFVICVFRLLLCCCMYCV
jgi:hypothetical protein